jgi:hypothetical protein
MMDKEQIAAEMRAAFKDRIFVGMDLKDFHMALAEVTINYVAE